MYRIKNTCSFICEIAHAGIVLWDEKVRACAVTILHEFLLVTGLETGGLVVGKAVPRHVVIHGGRIQGTVPVIRLQASNGNLMTEPMFKDKN